MFVAIPLEVQASLTVGVPIGGGFTLQSPVTVRTLPAAELEYDVTLTLVVEGDRYVTDEIVCKRKPGGVLVTSDGMRSIPVAQIVRDAAPHLAGLIMRFTTDEHGQVFGEPLGDWSEDDLTAVAGIYRTAHACGIPPTKAVAEALGLSQSTAAKRVMRARADGLLGKTTSGRAGS